MRVSKFLSGSGLNHVVGGRYVIGWKCFPILWGWIHVQGVLKSYDHHFYPIDINVVTDFWIPVHPYISDWGCGYAKPASSFPGKDQQHMVQRAFAMASAGCLVLCRRLTIALMLHTTAEGCFIPRTTHLDHNEVTTNDAW